MFLAMRYAYTVYLFGGEPFRAALLDERVDPLLRALGLVPEPAIAERSWRVALPTFQRPSGDVGAHYLVTVPPGVWPRCTDPCRQMLPNETDAAEVNTITKVTKVFNGSIPAKPWPSAICAMTRLSASQCASATTPANTLLNALTRAVEGTDLASRYGFYAFPEVGSAPLTVTEAPRGGSVLPLLLAAAAGFVYFRSQGGGLGRFGRVPTTIKAGRLRKLARRKWHEGKYAEAKRLERRANQISRSA